jgi:hypothetical protein
LFLPIPTACPRFGTSFAERSLAVRQAPLI